MVYNNFGSAIFMGPTTSLRYIKLLNPNDYGLKHTGQVGDAIIGSLLGKAVHEKPHLDSFGYSSGGKNGFDIDLDRYDNYEQMLLYSRGFLGATASHLLVGPYVQVVSPFLDNDFFDYCMSLPLEMRVNHKIYIKWILTKYPEAAEFKWTYTNAKIKHNILLTHTVLWLKNRSRQFTRRMLYKAHLVKNPYCKIGMNPVDYLIEENSDVKQYWDGYYKDNIGMLKGNNELSDFFVNKYRGSYFDKALVLTALAFIKLNSLEVSGD